ncbi:hypothetical protein TIFTF001_009635 [Ficus carica]|uniref:Ferritin n=1 Tax=Ficus carica TaxID=3494 RepID=A0AA88D3S2_FICCA|nr:hypothetical protein TIFTF001_009635 [Ficus carica]
MFLRSTVLALPFSTLHGSGKGNGHGGYWSSFSGLSLCSKKTFSSNFGLNSENGSWGKKFVVSASREYDFVPLEGVVFRPFEEVQKDSLLVPSNLQLSLARQRFSDVSEAAVNEQINVEYNVSYVYHAMFAYFDRDNIALKGLAKFFKKSSEEEREHAENFCSFAIGPVVNFTNSLLERRQVAETKNDPQMADFIESEFLTEQVESIKKIAEYVAQLRLVGKGHGVWHFDQKLLHEADAV